MRTQMQQLGMVIQPNQGFSLASGLTMPLLVLKKGESGVVEEQFMDFGRLPRATIMILGETPDNIATIGWDGSSHYIQDESDMVMVRRHISRRGIFESMRRVIGEKGFFKGLKHIYSHIRNKVEEMKGGSFIWRLIEMGIFGKKAAKSWVFDVLDGMEEGWEKIPLNSRGEGRIAIRSGDAISIAGIEMEIQTAGNGSAGIWKHFNETAPATRGIAESCVLDAVQFGCLATGQTFSLKPNMSGEVTIGRGAENNIVLFDESVSKRQAVVFQRGSDIFIKDLSNRKTTLMDDSIVEEAQIFDGAKLCFGGSEFVVRHFGMTKTVLTPLPFSGDVVARGMSSRSRFMLVCGGEAVYGEDVNGFSRVEWKKGRRPLYVVYRAGSITIKSDDEYKLPEVYMNGIRVVPEREYEIAAGSRIIIDGAEFFFMPIV